MSDAFLSRYAECMFWMSRYMERAENIASLLEVTYSFSEASSNEQNWHSLLSLYCDEDAFRARYASLTAENVIRFYFIDGKHSNSIWSCLQAARFNARQLRPLISGEMWMQVNTLYSYLKPFEGKAVQIQDLWRVLSEIRKQCQTLSGMAETGLYRDQGWYFYLIGRQIERTDQSTRLLDIKYHLLLPSLSDVGSVLDSSQWFALLRAASGYHAFRREYPHVLSPLTVAGFLLLDRRFPRSVSASLKTLGWALNKSYWQFGLEEMSEIIEMNNKVLLELKNNDIRAIIAQGLHEYLDRIQLHLIQLTDYIARHFFRNDGNTAIQSQKQ